MILKQALELKYHYGCLAFYTKMYIYLKVHFNYSYNFSEIGYKL